MTAAGWFVLGAIFLFAFGHPIAGFVCLVLTLCCAMADSN
jgi:hypothetical protein